jgi:hypothetical protein
MTNNSGSDKLQEELTLGVATDLALGALKNNNPAAALSQEEIEKAQEKALKIVEGAKATGNTPLKGMQDMRNLSLSIGLPVPRVLFESLINKVEATPGRKKIWRKAISGMSEIKVLGCIDVKLPASGGKSEDIAYLVLEKCGKTHDLTAQLNKLYSRIPASRREEIRGHLSMLIYLGRSAYSLMANKLEPTLKEVGKKLPKEFDPFVMGVDYGNTTLYLPYGGDDRVGIFVHLKSDLDSDEKTEAKK